GGAGHGRDVRDRQAGLAKGARGAAGRDEREAGPDEALGEGDEPGLVRHGQERAPGTGSPDSPRSTSIVAARSPAPGARIAPARRRATARGRSRCSTALIRSWRAASSSPATSGTASWRTIGPP